MFAFASVGCGRWKAERSRSGAYRGTKEVAKRQSRHPTEAGASVPFTTRDERLRREASRAGAKSAQAGRGTEHPLVPVVWRMRLGTLLFCEHSSGSGIRRAPTVFDLERRFCDNQLPLLYAALNAFQCAFCSCGSIGMASRHICFDEDLPAVLQRRAGRIDRIDQSEYVQDFSRIDSGDARRCWRFGWDVGDGSGAIPKQGGQGRRK